ncbi:glycosyltransferase family 4 protein, partial [Candidatus Uhrbacteria bacterium]|nr:glycosyltransferase family 4 protein [Candidatus Uhrbacteria bacterium]
MSRIALVTLDYPPEFGGVARYLGNLVKSAHGEIDVFVPETHATDGPGKVTAVKLLATTFIRWLPAIGFIRQLKKDYEWVLVSHALPLGTAAWIARLFGGPKYAVLMHGLDLRLALTSKRKRWILRHVLHGADLVIANSEFTAQEITTFNSHKPIVITPGVESILYPKRSNARRTLGINEQEMIILSIARLVPRKGIDELIKVLPNLPPNARMVVIGDGVDYRRLRELAEPVADRVQFILHATDEERNQWLAAADIFALLPRDEGRDVEGFGIVFLEAAQAGLPIIASVSGGVAEAVVGGVTGICVPSENSSR